MSKTINKPKTYLFDLTVTLNQPVTVTPPSLTASSPKYPNRVPKTIIEGEERLQIPSSSFRGKLRRSAVGLAREYMSNKTGKEKALRLMDQFFLTIGGIKGKGAEKSRSAEWFDDLRKTNPLISIFGSGDPFIPGRISIPMLVANEPVKAEIADGVRSNDFTRSPENLDLLNPEDQQVLYALLGGQKEQSGLKKRKKIIEKEIKDEIDPSEQALLKVQLAEIDEALEALVDVTKGVALQLPLAGYERIPLGTRLSGRISIHRSNNVELGFLLATMDALSYTPIVGGKIANGCGEFSFTATVSEASLGNPKTQIGEVIMNPYEGLKIIDSPDSTVLSEALSVWKDISITDTLEFSKPAA